MILGFKSYFLQATDQLDWQLFKSNEKHMCLYVDVRGMVQNIADCNSFHHRLKEKGNTSFLTAGLGRIQSDNFRCRTTAAANVNRHNQIEVEIKWGIPEATENRD